MRVGGSVSSKTRAALNFRIDGEEEGSREAQKKLKEKFKPLIEWLKEETKDVVRDGEFIYTIHGGCLLTITFLVVISNRLVTSACAVVADEIGYTANLEKLMGEPPFCPVCSD